MFSVSQQCGTISHRKATTMARKTGINVSATIPTDLHEVLQDYRWAQKVDKFTDVIRDALTQFAVDNLDYVPAESDDDAVDPKA